MALRTGRGGNVWVSPEGCLMFSFKSEFDLARGHDFPFFQYAVSLGVLRGIVAVPACSVSRVRAVIVDEFYLRRAHRKLTSGSSGRTICTRTK